MVATDGIVGESPVETASVGRGRWPSLYVQVLIACVLGALLGYFRPTWGQALEPLGIAFVRVVKMLIGPIIFTTVVLGFAGMSELKKLGRVGWKALLYFELVTTIALGIGYGVAKTVVPGSGLQSMAAAENVPRKVQESIEKAKDLSTVKFLVNIIPETFVGAFTSGEVLQVLFLAILCGFVLVRCGEKTPLIIAGLQQVSHVLFDLVALITRAAPVAAFGAIAYTVGEHGLSALVSLGRLVLCVYLTCGVFVFLVLGLIARLHGFSLLRILVAIKEELFLVLGTSSSETALPSLMKKLSDNGCPEWLVGMVIPAGYSFNLDGTCIYLTTASLFLAQATGTDLTVKEEFTLFAVLLLTSKGAAAVTGGGYVTLAATLQTVGRIPVTSLGMIVGVDRFLSEIRAITNLIGNTVAALVLARWENAFDRERGQIWLPRSGSALVSSPREKPE